MTDVNAEVEAFWKKEEQYWADVKAGKLPHPLVKADSTKTKEEIMSENLKLSATINRQIKVIEELKEQIIVMQGQLDALKNPPKKSTKKGG